MFVNVFQVRLYLCRFICYIHLICVVNQIQFMQLRLYLPSNSTSGSSQRGGIFQQQRQQQTNRTKKKITSTVCCLHMQFQQIANTINYIPLE